VAFEAVAVTDGYRKRRRLLIGMRQVGHQVLTSNEEGAEASGHTWT
jgi:hypothetical protein